MRSDLIGLNDIHLNYLHFGDETHSYDVSDDSHEDVVLQKKTKTILLKVSNI